MTKFGFVWSVLSPRRLPFFALPSVHSSSVGACSRRGSAAGPACANSAIAMPLQRGGKDRVLTRGFGKLRRITGRLRAGNRRSQRRKKPASIVLKLIPILAMKCKREGRREKSDRDEKLYPPCNPSCPRWASSVQVLAGCFNTRSGLTITQPACGPSRLWNSISRHAFSKVATSHQRGLRKAHVVSLTPTSHHRAGLCRGFVRLPLKSENQTHRNIRGLIVCGTAATLASDAWPVDALSRFEENRWTNKSNFKNRTTRFCAC